MLTVDIEKKIGYDFYAYFLHDFENFLKSHGITNIISYYEPCGHGTRYTFFTLSLDSGKELYNLLKVFLDYNNIDIKEVGVYYE